MSDHAGERPQPDAPHAAPAKTAKIHVVVVAVLALLAATIAVDSAGSVADAARAHRGRIKVIVVTPAGVPATALFKKQQHQVAAAKGTTGTRRTATLKVAAGTWKAAARPVLYRDHYYLPVAEPGTVKVRPGRTTTATVTWRPAAVAHDLRVTDLQSARIDLEFTNPDGTEDPIVSVRYAAGTTAPKSVSTGEAATVSSTSATAAGLTPGTVYSFGLFTQVDGKWLGPMPLTVTTAPDDGAGTSANTAEYVTNPGTVIVPKGTDLAPHPLPDGGVTIKLPAGASPVVGTPIVLPPSRSLAGGFIGRTTAVAADGTTVTLQQAPLGVAFDYLKVSIPDLAGTGAARQLRPAASSPQSGVGRASSDGDGSEDPPCSLDTGGTLDIDADVDFVGQFSMELAMKKHFGVPTSAGLNAKLLLVAKVGATIDVDSKIGFTCGIDLGAWSHTWLIDGVPLLLRWEPKASLSVSAEARVSHAGYRINAGFDASVYLPLASLSHTPDIDVDKIASAEPIEPDVEHAVSVTLTGKVGGELAFGPGIAVKADGGEGEPDSGVQAGIAGHIDPVVAAFQVNGSNGQYCVEASLRGEAGVKLFAAAWLPGFTHDISWNLWTGAVDYAGPWRFPDPCDPPCDLADWTFDVDILTTWKGDGFDETFRTHYTDDSPTDCAVTWTASREGHDRFPCINGGENGSDVHGSGTGDGELTAASGPLPQDWGLDPDADWWIRLPFPRGDYELDGTSYNCNEETTSGPAGSEGPLVEPVFMPGTLETLNAKPVGTQLHGTYAKSSASGQQVDTTTVSWTATKEKR